MQVHLFCEAPTPQPPFFVISGFKRENILKSYILKQYRNLVQCEFFFFNAFIEIL